MHIPLSLTIATIIPISAVFTACNGNGASAPLTQSTAFEVEATIEVLQEPVSCSGDSSNLIHFQMYLDAIDDNLVEAIVSTTSGSDRGAFDQSNATLSLRDPVALETFFLNLCVAADDYRVVITSLQLDLRDTDGDGGADAFTGAGEGMLEYAIGDILYNEPIALHLTSARDTTPPELTLVGPTSNRNVLDGLSIVASEPLADNRTVTLVSGDTRIELQPSGPGQAVTSYSTDQVLPFGATLSVEWSAPPEDLSGLAAESMPTSVSTRPLPALVPSAGFEEETLGKFGGATIVDGIGTLPAIAGERSLLVEDGGLTVYLPLSGAESSLRFSARLLYPARQAYGCPRHILRVGAPGQMSANRLSPRWEYDNTEDTGDSWWGTAAAAVEMTFALPAGIRDGLVFDITHGPRAVPPCPDVAILFDDLRVE